jgi:hypothetical protein
VEPEAIRELNVERTYVGGRLVFDREGAAIRSTGGAA